MGGDQIPSLPGKKRRQMPGGRCWSFYIRISMICSARDFAIIKIQLKDPN